MMNRLQQVLAMIIAVLMLGSSYVGQSAEVVCISYDEIVAYVYIPEDGGYVSKFKVIICRRLPPDEDPNTPDAIGVKIPLPLKVCEADYCDPAWPASKDTILLAW